MPVDIRRVEPGIYVAHLTGTVPLEALLGAQQRGSQMAESHQDARYVLILDIDRSTQMPFDIRQGGQVLEKNSSIAVLTVGASLHIRFLATILGQLFRHLGRIEHVSTVEEAVKKARRLLNEV